METLNLDHPEFTRLSSQILERGNLLRFIAHGSSMAPFIRDGDVLTVEPIHASQLLVGNIVFCRGEGDAVIVHRIVHIEDKSGSFMMRVRGDASPGSEQTIPSDCVLGLVKRVEREGVDIRVHQGYWRRLGSLWVHLFPFPLLVYRILRKIRTALTP